MNPYADSLQRRLQFAWKRTDNFFRIIKPEGFWAQPIVWRHPLIFYVGHLPAFAWNQIGPLFLEHPSYNAHFDEMFSRGIDPDVDTGACHLHPAVPEDWPDLEEIVFYRDRVREGVLNSLELLKSRRQDARASHPFTMVLEHEFMHQETLLYMLQELPSELKCRPPGLPEYQFGKGEAPIEIKIPAGRVTLGASSHKLIFGWDNEFPRHVVPVEAFRIQSTPVTNLDFFEFVASGAYEKERYWTESDWAWKQRVGIRHPNFWLQRGADWLYRTLFDELPLEKVYSWPVYASLAEARAFARWKEKRLPTEAEFCRAAWGSPDGREHPFPWGENEPCGDYGNFDFAHWSPVPVGSNPLGMSAWGVHEFVGNGWEWTETPFAPFPGFVPLGTYPEYSADFFDGKHYVLKGASWATASGLIRSSFRNWYQAHYPHVFAKFRCVSD